jgi:cysteinyl-tRNA synthetase
MELDGWLVGAPEIGWKKNHPNGREVNPGFHVECSIISSWIINTNFHNSQVHGY